MAFSKIDTNGLALDAVDNTILDLSSNFAFSGTITGAGGGKVLASYHTQTSSGSASNNTWSLQSGLTTNITPASSSSKFLLMVGCQAKINHGEGMGIRIDRDSTQILVNPVHSNDVYYTPGSGDVMIWSIKNFIDSPSTSSAFDYKVYCYTSGGTVQIPNTSINYITILELSR